MIRRARFAGVVAVVVGGLVLAGCSDSSDDADTDSTTDSTTDTDTTDTTATDLLAAHGLDGLGAVELIEELDRTPVDERPTDLIASVRPDTLLISDVDGEEQVEIDIERDEFYVSLAPYADQTHDCFFHSLTTCLGELRNEEVHVTVTDQETDEVLVDEAMTTFDNGFFGLWLPPDIDVVIEVEHDGRTGSIETSTGAEDATCLTTLQVV